MEGREDDVEVVWVAECASLHKGDIGLAYRMLLGCAESGATIAKFQLGHAKTGSPKAHIRYAPMEWAHQLAEWCEDLGIEFMASIWTMDALELAREVGMKRYKIAHQMALSKDPRGGRLVEAILADGKETFISAPPPRMHRFRKKNARWLHCQGDYPLYPEHLKMPVDFRKQGFYGYSSHMHGMADAYLAISRGARFIEKHVLLDHELVTRDASFALSFGEFAEMTRVGNTIARIA